MTLIERLEAAEGPSRELDAEIAEQFGWRIWRLGLSAINPFGMHGSPAEGIGIYNPRVARELPAYTASLDATLALVEEVLPGVPWSLERCETFEVDMWPGPGFENVIVTAHKSPAITLLIALLKAKDAGGADG